MWLLARALPVFARHTSIVLILDGCTCHRARRSAHIVLTSRDRLRESIFTTTATTREAPQPLARIHRRKEVPPAIHCSCPRQTHQSPRIPPSRARDMLPQDPCIRKSQPATRLAATTPAVTRCRRTLLQPARSSRGADWRGASGVHVSAHNADAYRHVGSVSPPAPPC